MGVPPVAGVHDSETTGPLTLADRSVGAGLACSVNCTVTVMMTHTGTPPTTVG